MIMCSVLVSCFDAIVIYSCLSYTSVVLYLSASASLTLTSVILHSANACLRICSFVSVNFIKSD